MTTEHLKDGLAPARLYLEHHLLAGMATRETGAVVKEKYSSSKEIKQE
jgi:hypothetical protein